MAHGIGIVLHPAHGVPAPGQLVGHVSGDAALQLEVVAGLAPGAAVQPAGRVDGFLRGHAVIQHAGGDGGLRLGLALAAHGTVDEERLAVPGQHGRVQGVEGTLAGLKAVDVRRVEGEEAAPVLEQHARAPGHDALPCPSTTPSQMVSPLGSSGARLVAALSMRMRAACRLPCPSESRRSSGMSTKAGSER